MNVSNREVDPTEKIVITKPSYKSMFEKRIDILGVVWYFFNYIMVKMIVKSNKY